MKINQIELYNFGPYEGRTVFDLTVEEPRRRICVIGGKNGAGKTTLFTAIQIGLYGNYAFGYKTAGRYYLNEIYALVNNRSRLRDDGQSYVKISFQHNGNRERCDYEITRRWTWAAGDLAEELTAVRNGEELGEEEVAGFQNYLLHLIPPDLLKLYFFDGEKIAEYFLSENRINIREALMVLSGNDTFDILYGAVKRVLNTAKGGPSGIASSYLELQAETESLREHIAALNGARETLAEEFAANEALLEQRRAQYSAAGGLTLEQWTALQTELKGEEEKRERIHWQRRAAATEILPFLIIKDLVEKVVPQIKREEGAAARRLLEEKLSEEGVVRAFSQAMDAVGVSSADKVDYVISAVSAALLAGGEDRADPLFALSDDEKMQVHSVLARIAGFDTGSLSKFQRRLDKSIQRSREIRRRIQSSDLEHMEDHIREVSERESELRILQAKIDQTGAEIKSCQEELSRKLRELSAARKQMEGQLKQASVAALSGRVLLLLEDLQSNIYSLLLRRVEADLKYKLNQLLRKPDFFDEVSIDDDFNVHMIQYRAVPAADLIRITKRGGRQALRRSIGETAFRRLLGGETEAGNAFVIQLLSGMGEYVELPLEVDKEQMSSGEKQIFVMSLYWALMQQSESELPFIIDTPFARIDTEHRAKITENFFLDLPGQLFVLSTNEELTQNHLDMMRDQISHVYMLEYGGDQQTHVHQNQYFEV